MPEIRKMLESDGAIINATDVAWITDQLCSDLAYGYDGHPESYREPVTDVIGALIGRGVSPIQLRAMMRAEQ